MKNNQKGITEIAFQRLYNDELMEQKYSTAKAIKKYLDENKNFRNLSSLIKETMILAKVCTEDEEDIVFINELYKLLGFIEPNNLNNESVKKRVKRWINGTTKSMKSFDEAIEVCYALNLDIDQTNTFLNKCGFSSLSSRNATHAVHYYCILNHKSLKTANDLLYSFNNAKYQKTSTYESKGENSNEITETEYLWNGLNANWETDESFLSSFLIPNKYRFIGYSRKARFNYLRTKNIFMTSILAEIAQMEKRDIDEQEFCKESYPIQYKLRSLTRNYIDDKKMASAKNGFVFKNRVIDKIKYTKIPRNGSLKTYQEITDETFNVISRMKELAIEINDSDFQDELSKFISTKNKGLLTMEGAFKNVLSSLIGGNDERIRPILKQSCKKYAPILNCFPTPKSIKKYEENPALTDSVLSARKIIILLYFIIFCHEYVIQYYYSLENYQATAQLFYNNFSLKGFIEETNKALKQCSLSILYPPNQFDCLILMIIRGAEKRTLNDEPLEIFNEVLNQMFYYKS